MNRNDEWISQLILFLTALKRLMIDLFKDFFFFFCPGSPFSFFNLGLSMLHYCPNRFTACFAFSFFGVILFSSFIGVVIQGELTVVFGFHAKEIMFIDEWTMYFI